MNGLTKYMLLAGSAALATGIVPNTDQRNRQVPMVFPSHPSTLTCDYTRSFAPDGRSYLYNYIEDDTVFKFPIVSKVHIKLKKGFQPFEFFIED
jgi:hypothetical protein